MDPQISGTRKIRAKHSNLIVDVLGSGKEDGRPVVQNPDVGAATTKNLRSNPWVRAITRLSPSTAARSSTLREGGRDPGF
jgi:hypothetical protein